MRDENVGSGQGSSHTQLSDGDQSFSVPLPNSSRSSTGSEDLTMDKVSRSLVPFDFSPDWMSPEWEALCNNAAESANTNHQRRDGPLPMSSPALTQAHQDDNYDGLTLNYHSMTDGSLCNIEQEASLVIEDAPEELMFDAVVDPLDQHPRQHHRSSISQVGSVNQHMGGPCSCLNIMVNALETLGAQCASSLAADELLMHVGIIATRCDAVLRCTKCDICEENSMLLASVTQQLSTHHAS
ncbi:hypothetical protein MY5147_007498 [Beauveria neobassiana]